MASNEENISHVKTQLLSRVGENFLDQNAREVSSPSHHS